MSEPAWEFQHSAECKATRQFAWRFWTDIANWNDPPAEFDLDGPFESGARLTTTMPGQRWESIIRDLKPEREATIEMQLPDAILSFNWKFEELSGDETLITQRLVLSGPNAQSFLAQASIGSECTRRNEKNCCRNRTSSGSGEDLKRGFRR